jgi:hypothetical protein
MLFLRSFNNNMILKIIIPLNCNNLIIIINHKSNNNFKNYIIFYKLEGVSLKRA